MRAFGAVLARDLRLARRQGGDAGLAVLFFILGTVLVPLGIGPESALLSRIGAGLLWMMALLAALLSLERLFQVDWEDGSLDLIVLSPLPLSMTVLAKVTAHWLVTGLPITLASPVLAVLLNISPDQLGIVALTLLLGTPTLSLIGSVGAALTVGARRGGVLLTLLILPLYIPVLIFGAGTVDAAVAGPGAKSHLLMMTAMLLAALPLCPWAAAAALRHALD